MTTNNLDKKHEPRTTRTTRTVRTRRSKPYKLSQVLRISRLDLLWTLPFRIMNREQRERRERYEKNIRTFRDFRVFRGKNYCGHSIFGGKGRTLSSWKIFRGHSPFLFAAFAPFAVSITTDTPFEFHEPRRTR